MPTKKSKKTSTKSAAVWIPILVVFLAGIATGIIIYVHSNNTSGTTKTDYSAAPPADNNANNNRKNSTSPSSTLDNGNGSSTSSSGSSFQVSIVNSAVSNGNLHIGTMVSGITEGTCTLTAVKAGQSTLQLGTSTVRQNVNSYDCGVFNVSTSVFPTSGTWQIVLTVTNNGTSNEASTSANV